MSQGRGDASELVQDDGEDVQRTRKLGNPKLPSADEIDDHCKTHLPYRCWCKHCVQGRGVGPQHYATGHTSTIPRIGLDYFFLTKGGIKLRAEMTTAERLEA